MEACKEESDPRKVKEERKVRKMAEKARVDKNSAELMHKLDNADLAASPANEEFKRATLEVIEQFANIYKFLLLPGPHSNIFFANQT